MYSPKISEEFIPTLYHVAKTQNRAMTKLVNSIIENYIVSIRCTKCQSIIQVDEKVDTVFCLHCECEVFAEEV
jgi:hypothetical protein